MVAEALGKLLIDRFGRFNRKLYLYYALLELILTKPSFSIDSVRSLLLLPPRQIPSMKTLRTCLEQMISKRIIIRHRTDPYSVYTYDLSDEALAILASGKRYSTSFTDVKYGRWHNPRVYQKTTARYHPTPGYTKWAALLASGMETEAFLYAMQQLTSLEHLYIGPRGTSKKSSIPKTTFKLSRSPFSIDLPPEVYGRTNSNPYAYIGSTLLPFMRPVYDVGLNDGILFMVDFSSFEPRLLAPIANNPELIRFAQSRTNMYTAIYEAHLSEFPIGDEKRLILSWMNGASPKQIAEYLKSEVDYCERLEIADQVRTVLTQEYPEVEALRHQLATDWLEAGELQTPDGWVVPLHQPGKSRAGFKRPTKGQITRTAIAALLQSRVGRIGRLVMSEAAEAKHFELRLPVHDGFMCYCRKDEFELAVAEIMAICTKAVRTVSPSIQAPVKLEWAVDNTGVISSKEFINLHPTKPQIELQHNDAWNVGTMDRS